VRAYVTIYASYIEQFWNTASSKTVNSVKQIHVVVDSKDVVISESLVRGDLLFDDEDDEAVNQEEGDIVERTITTAASLEATQDSDNITKTQTTAMPNVDIPQGIDTCGRPRHKKPWEVLLLRLESQLKQKRCKAFIHSLDEERSSVHIEDSPKQGRIIEEIDKDKNINLRSSAKDKEKRIMQETELPKKLKKKEMIQLSLNEELAQKLYRGSKTRAEEIQFGKSF
nr:hypothetical protein [Tanacetum cinerariifolium]